jgi:hypothetical protein
MIVRKKAHEFCRKVLRLKKTIILRISPIIPAMRVGMPR